MRLYVGDRLGKEPAADAGMVARESRAGTSRDHHRTQPRCLLTSADHKKLVNWILWLLVDYVSLMMPAL